MRKIIIIELLCCLIAIFSLNAQQTSSYLSQFPIVAWHGVQEDEISVERFQELKDAGFTINFSIYSNLKKVDKALDAAYKAGIGMIVGCPELESNPEETVQHLKKHPATVGYFLRDEPSVSEFTELGKWAERIQSVDSERFCYLNLFPTGDSSLMKRIGAQNYREYISLFAEKVPLPFLSFDHYPVLENYELKPQWYENLEEFSDEAKKVNKNFWAFALSTKHGIYPFPTLASLRLQVYSDLAYGAQGLQYFTYFTPANDAVYDYQLGPIGLDGKRTDVYDLVKDMNLELKLISNIFWGAKVLSVRHTGEKIPIGTKRLTTLPSEVKVLDTHGSGAIVSILENRGKRYLLIVNRSLKDIMQCTFFADSSVKRVLKDGSLVNADKYTPTLNVQPGDILIYLL